VRRFGLWWLQFDGQAVAAASAPLTPAAQGCHQPGCLQERPRSRRHANQPAAQHRVQAPTANHLLVTAEGRFKGKSSLRFAVASQGGGLGSPENIGESEAAPAPSQPGLKRARSAGVTG